MVKDFESTIAWYNQNAAKYSASTLKLVPQEDIAKFIKLLPSEGKILDAGCGAGRDTNTIGEFRPTIGLDISSGLIKEARLNFPRSVFIEGDMLKLAFVDNLFIGIWSYASLVHMDTVQDVQVALSEFNRVLKPEGLLGVSVKAQTGEEETAVVSDKLSGHDRFFRYFTQHGLAGLLVQAGFRIVEIAQQNETVNNPHGRPEVEWIFALAKK